MREKYPFGFFTLLIIFSLAIFSIGNHIEREQSGTLLFAFLSAFTCYLLLAQDRSSFTWLLWAGIGTRLLVFLSLPSLSDDVYRFIWDGTLLKNGIHPFDHLPGFYLDQNIPGITQKLYDKLNSPDYFTVYPPINQFIFWVSSVASNDNWLVATNTMRALLLLSDIGSFLVLTRLLNAFGKPRHLAFLYFLNPLVILEFCGNVHFEGLVIFFLLAGIYLLHQSKRLLAGTALGIAIGTKLLPFIYLPFILLRGLKDKKWTVAIIAGIVAMVSILPMMNSSFIDGMQNSLHLYFQKFEFNASLYYLARGVGYTIYGYNNIAIIGPLLSVLSLLSIITISVFGVIKKWELPKGMLFILSTYLLFATTVHPWYILPLVAFATLSGYWYPIVWSLMAFGTYLGYSKTGYELPMSFVVIEYTIVGLVLILDFKRQKSSE